MEREEYSAEQLSALMDGELSERELDRLLAEIGQNPELRQQWSGHHAVRHLLFEKGAHGDSLPSRSVTLADRVAAALEQEATILAPGESRKQSKTESSTREGWFSRQWVPVALAASLAAIAVTVIQQTNLQPQLEVVAQAPTINAAGVTTEWVEVGGEWVERWINPLTQSPRVRSYLVRHDENRRSARQRGAALVSTAPPTEIVDKNQQQTRHIVGWQLGWLPDGFSRVGSLRHQIPSSSSDEGRVNVEHLVLSNGEDVFSVFIERSGVDEITEKQMESNGRKLNIYSYFTLGHRITVLGEVSMETVKRVAVSMEAEHG